MVFVVKPHSPVEGTMLNNDKHLVDIAAASTSVGAFLTDNLPNVAVVLTIIWTVFRIYELETVQKLLGKKVDEE